jgi:MutS domain V
LDVTATETWAKAPAVHFHRFLRLFALLLSVTGVVSIIAFFAQLLPLWPFVLILAGDFTIIFLLRERVTRITQVVDTAAQSLRIVSLLLRRLEQERFESSKLQRLAADLNVQGLAASKRIARLEHWIDWLDSSDHILVRVIRPILLWREQIAMAVEAWRQENGARAVQWIKCIGEFEALSSFASLAFERPQWCFPQLEDSNRTWQAEALQHPLLSPGVCVPNDVAFKNGLQLLIVSGSNMSGKSTLLRSIGLNTVLAWAGAPVAARSLQISCFQVASSMRVVDSLQDNRSRFYAEITRIRQIFELLKYASPVLFLLDELLSGTNSHDRLLGATGIVRNLVDSGAIGLITTHDLALAGLEDNLGTRARNVHFEDRLVDGRIEFDYKLKPGIVTHSNALELMRAVGLDV